MSLRSSLSKARGLGSAKEGSNHWLHQRFTALALIPLVIWLVYSLVSAANGKTDLFVLLSSPVNAVLMIALLIAMLYHGCLGIRVVIEDYVHSHFVKHALLIVIQFFTILTAIGAILSVIYLHTGAVDIKKKEKQLLLSNYGYEYTN